MSAIQMVTVFQIENIPVGGSAPEEGVLSISVVDKISDEKRMLVHRVNLTVHLEKNVNG